MDQKPTQSSRTLSRLVTCSTFLMQCYMHVYAVGSCSGSAFLTAFFSRTSFHCPSFQLLFEVMRLRVVALGMWLR